MQDVIKKIFDYSLEDIMGERFGRYAKAIIQDRALPDVRDGLKPVQRRILYMMYESHNTYDKPYRKSARVVGDVMGKLHPHGDSSIYEAMVRMSQWWKQNTTYIDMHGNNGSMDGDGPAAMRYTEARLSKISNELLKEINKDTVLMTFNYDDTEYEPTVLPVKFPNLLVNGSTGISAGYATNIPPHNLGEVIDATIKRIDSPNCTFETITSIIKGPDFPTGGIACGQDGIIEAFKTGRGRIIVKSKYEVVNNKGKEQIIITEIPFEVNKASLVKKIDEIRIDKKIEGIQEVRDESDLENPETIVIDLKKDVDSNLIINYLLKNTEMQVSYNYNMVAIVNRRPMMVGIVDILDAYIEHQREVITRRTEFDLEHAKARMHIVEGLIKALDILDEVIQTIRSSKNKTDAIENLVKEYDFTEKQAEAIVNLQLYRLTNTDVDVLKEEYRNLLVIIQGLEEILSDETKLKGVMKEELRKIKAEYAVPRKTEIKAEITEIKVDTTSMIPKEDCIVVVSKDGYVKRVSLRSYQAKTENTALKEGDYVLGLYELNTLDTVLLFTDLGNYLYLPVYELPDLKWKDIGKHVSNLIQISSDENIIASIPISNFTDKQAVTLVSRDGMIKRTLLSDLKVQRYTKPLVCMKLKPEDKVVDVKLSTGNRIFITTHSGYGLMYDIKEIPITGVRSSGVKAISVKNDFVVSFSQFHEGEFLTVITSKNTGKRIKMQEFEISSRGRKGMKIIRDVKTNPYYILKSFVTNGREMLGLRCLNDVIEMKLTELPIADKQSTGTVLTKAIVQDAYLVMNLEKQVEGELIEEDISLDSVDEKIMTIDDFLDNFDVGENR